MKMKHYQLRIRATKSVKLFNLAEFERDVVRFLDGQGIENHMGSMYNYITEQQATLAAIQFGDKIRLVEVK